MRLNIDVLHLQWVQSYVHLMKYPVLMWFLKMKNAALFANATIMRSLISTTLSFLHYLSSFFKLNFTNAMRILLRVKINKLS